MNGTVSEERAGSYEHPSYVLLETLAQGKLDSIGGAPLRLDGALSVGGWSVETFPLNHYSGSGARRQMLDAFGFLIGRSGGPAVAYLCDHEPTEETRSMEDRVLSRAHLAVVDAHFESVCLHAFGHGSIESAALVPRRHSGLSVIASHHGPTFTDAGIEAACASRWWPCEPPPGRRGDHLPMDRGRPSLPAGEEDMISYIA